MSKAFLNAKKRLSHLFSDDGGAALIEYALLIGMVAVLCIASLTLLKDRINAAYGVIGTKLTAIQ